MKNHKRVRFETTVGSAIEDVKSEVETLRDEIESWKDNLEGTGLENTGKYEQLEEAYDSLDAGSNALDSIDLEESLKGSPVIEKKIIYFEFQAYGTSNACAKINSIMEALTERGEEIEEALNSLDDTDKGVIEYERLTDHKTAIEDIELELQDALDNLKSVEFPGMY